MKSLIALSTEISTDEKKKRSFGTGYDLYLQNTYYSQWVLDAGAIPVLIPPNPCVELPELLKRVDGLILTGGSDIDPTLWGEKELEPGGMIKPLSQGELKRSAFEQKLCQVALDMDIPMLGVCRGHQQLNVCCGGSLYQDMERQQNIAGHAAFDRPFDKVHSIDLNAWPTKSLALKEYEVTSSHHQSIQRLGKDLEVLARASNDPEVIEAIRHRNMNFCVGVQWHPERMAGSELSNALMHDLLQAASSRADT